MISESLNSPHQSFSMFSLIEMGQSLPSSFSITIVTCFFSSQTLMPGFSSSSCFFKKLSLFIYALQLLFNYHHLHQFYYIYLAPIMNPLLLSFSAHLEGELQIAICPSSRKLFSLGMDDVYIAWNIDDMTERRQTQIANNPDAQIFTSIAYSNRDNILALGTQSGKVFLMNNQNSSEMELAYKGSGKVTALNFTQSCRFLAIGLEQSSAIIYSMDQKKFVRCVDGHEGFATFFLIGKQETHAISLGSDGYANVYEFRSQSFSLSLRERFKIIEKNVQKVLTCCERPDHNGTFAIAGSTTLQQIIINPQQIRYRVKPTIHQKQQIIQCLWINRGTLILLAAQSIFLWDYTHETKILSLNNMCFMNVVTEGKKFYASDNRGLLYKYESEQLAERGLREQHMMEEQENEGKEMEEEDEQRSIKKLKKKRKIKVKPEISIAATIITDYPQPAIESSYAGYLQNRFMFYNHIGCIIERSDGDTSLLELQYHDKFKLRRIKFQSSSKTLFYFALTDDCFMYAGRNHAYFERELCLGRSIKERVVDKWSYVWEDIEGVLLGSDWAAIASNSQIKIFDYSGNQIHSICFDKAFLAMASFQDQLFIAYNSAIPISSTRIFQMKAYKVTLHSCKLQRIVQMPVKSESTLNWFGFSQEGILFAQDTSETVRMYMWDTNEWINVYKGNEETHSLFIQHIENYEIFGFKIELKEGQPAVPTVLPRSLPRKIPLQIPNHQLDFLLPDENLKLKYLYLKKYILQQEEFRNKRWYKFKYSRRQDHPRYNCTSNIQSEQELQVMATNIDVQVVDCIKKLLPALQERTNEGLRQMKIRLFNVAYFLTNYSETLRKLESILKVSENACFMDIDDRVDRTEARMMEQEPVKYCNLSRLNALVDMGWIQGNEQ